MLKLGFQNLNDDKNFGAEFGLRNLIIHQKVYGGFSDGYYFDYFTYSGFIQAFIIKNIVSLNVDYKKIEKYKFFSLGLSFTFKR